MWNPFSWRSGKKGARSSLALAGLVWVAGLAARAQSSAPGYVDLSEHMRKMDQAAKLESCRRENARKKKHNKKYKEVECAPDAAAQATSTPAKPLAPPAVSAPKHGATARHPAAAPTPAPPPDDAPATGEAELVTRRRVIAPPSFAPAPATPGDEPLAADARGAAEPRFAAPQSVSERVIEPGESPSFSLPDSSASEGQGIEAPAGGGRPLRGTDSLLAGGGVLANTLTLGGDVKPGSVAIAFTLQTLSDQQGSLHNILLFALGGAPCDEGGPCSLSARGLVGFSPAGVDTFPATATGAAQTDSLHWSSLYVGAGLKGRFRSGFGLEASALLQSLTMSYILDSGATTPAIHDASLQIVKLSTAASFDRGGFELRLYLGGTLYPGGDVNQSSTAPLRGVFYDPELSGLASGPEGFFGKLEARYRFSSGFSAQASYGLLTYAGSEWASAQLLSAQLGQELGRFHLALGLAAQLDSLSSPAANQPSLANVFVSGSLGLRFN